MARPKKSINYSAKEHIENTFMAILQKKSLSKITVSEIVKTAGCNRSTFYYYFRDVPDLAEQVIQKNLPTTLPQTALEYFFGKTAAIQIDADSINSIRNIGFLLGKSDSVNLSQSVEKYLINMWLKQLQIPQTAITKDIMYTLEFLAGGIVGIIIRYGNPFDGEAICKAISTVHKVFSNPALTFMTTPA